MANYTIIGGDGKEYGPIPLADVQRWIAEGRANSQTKVRVEGSTEWQLISQVPELANAPRPISPIPASFTAGGHPPKTSGLAVTSLVLGILGMFSCGLSALLGLILGIVAMVKIKNSNGELGGKGLALAGVIVSAFFTVLMPFFIAIYAAMLLPALAAAKGKAQVINCVNNEKQLGLAVRIYAGDHTNHLPPAATWCDAIHTEAGSDKIYQCPAKPDDKCGYAFNAKLDGLDLDAVNPETVMIFESDGGWNAHGGPELLASPAHHPRVWVVTLADGSVEQLTQARLTSLRWEP